MRILVYPHDLAMGGSQLNAIDLAHAMSRKGHEVAVYGQPGPLETRIAQLGLELIESPPAHRRPTRDIVRDLGHVIDERHVDIAHGFEWPPGLECYLACRGRHAARAVTTVMSMAVAPFLPRTMPVVVGTEQIAAVERSSGRELVSVVEPPVDTDADRPAGDLSLADLQDLWGLRDDRPVVVVVSRLARQLKLEGLLTAIDAVVALHAERPTHLLIVGDGEARGEVEQRAAHANQVLGYRAVVIAGEMPDPRPAYEIADVCLAMGGSALRSMAFGKPLVVQGEGGFFRVLTPRSLPDFLWTGWYGHGSLTDDPVDELRALLSGLLRDPVLRLELGLFGRSVVEDRFSLRAAADRQLAIYEKALAGPPATSGVDRRELLAVGRFARQRLTARARRLVGRGAADDYNARPVAAHGPGRGEPAGTSGAGEAS